MIRRSALAPVLLVLAAAALTWWVAGDAFRDAEDGPEAPPGRAEPAPSGASASTPREPATRRATSPSRPIREPRPSGDAPREPAAALPTGSMLVTVRLVDAMNRAPVRSAEVVVGNWLYRLGADALMRLPYDPPLLEHLEMSAPGYCPAAFRLVDESMGESGEALPVLEVRLEPAAELVGTVRGAKGAPEPEAVVRVGAHRRQRENPEPQATPTFVVRRTRSSWSATTGRDGSYRFAALPANRKLWVTGSLGRYGHLRRHPTLVLRPGETRRLDLVGLPTGALLGRVVDHLGQPVAGARVSATVRSGMGTLGFGRSWATSNNQGHFRIENVPAGQGTLEVGPPSAIEDTPLDFASVTAAFAVTRQNEVVRPVITVHPGLTVRGRVVSPDGAPIEGVRVEPISEPVSRRRVQRELRAHTDAGGGFRLGPLAEGTHRLVARGRGRFGDSEPISVRAGAEDVVLALTHACALAGEVRDGATGATARGRVRLWPRAPGARARIVDTDGEGRFAFERVPPGDYDLTATAWSGKRVGVRHGVRIVKRQSVRDVVITLHEGGTLCLDGPDELVLEDLAVESGGRIVHREPSVRPADLPSFTVPAGRVRVRGRLRGQGDAPDETLDRTAEIAAGSAVTLELTRGP